MKKIIILSLLTLLSVAVLAQAETSAKQPKGKKKEIMVEDTLPKLPEIKFNSLVHDYGTIQKGGDGVCFFEFTNTGRADLQLSNVTSSCGCTIPQWPKEPIPPGGSASIKVSYNTSRVGVINKNVYVDSNVGEKVTLTIRGNVIEEPKEIVPESKQSSLINE